MLIAAYALVATAQPNANAEEKKKIADIKKDSAYLSAEVTTTTADEALRLAHEMLIVNINKWMKEQQRFDGATQAVILNKGKHTEEIVLPRANMHRAFVYVKKDDILPSTDATVLNMQDGQADNVDAKAAAAASQTATAEPKKAAGPAAVVESKTHSMVVSELLKAENTGQLLKTLKTLKAGGKISEYVKLGDLKDKNAAEYIMVVFNRDGRVEAVLSEGDTRRNLSNGNADAVSNYKNRGAIGVKVNEPK
jgi:hypothetical protein